MVFFTRPTPIKCSPPHRPLSLTVPIPSRSCTARFNMISTVFVELQVDNQWRGSCGQSIFTGILGCIRRLPSTVCFDFDAQNGTNPFSPDTSDGSPLKNPILLWLRTIDQLNTHDASYELAIAGGVTTAQILPGSANNVGMQHVILTCLYVNTIRLVQVVKLSSSNFDPQSKLATSKIIELPHLDPFNKSN